MIRKIERSCSWFMRSSAKLWVSEIVDKVPSLDARNGIIHSAEGTTNMSAVHPVAQPSTRLITSN